TIEHRLDAYVLKGSSLAIVGDPIEAEHPFRFLLRGRPDFDLPADTPPKILAVFRKVQVEERFIANQMKELERKKAVEQITIKSDIVDVTRGGVPVSCDVTVRDPRGAVSAVSVLYRREGQAAFSSLALVSDEGGGWVGAVPGEWSENDAGFTMEYYVALLDAEGAMLKSAGSSSSPLRVTVEPGAVGDAP